ncbi:MAG: phage terminase large subunit [Sphingobium sp.]
MNEQALAATLDPGRVAATVRALARKDLAVFVEGAFRVLDDEPYLRNWHVNAIAYELMRLDNGDNRRLVITMPPRTMKSFIASVCLPAWLLGRNPGEKIICVSYAQDLAEDFAFQTRKLMQSDWYRRVFPATHIDPKRGSARKLTTTRNGYRYSTSTGGTLTGRGGAFIIIDDPIRAADANSETMRENSVNWFRTTVLSRLNNPRKGKIIIVAQRLHMEDLPGHVLSVGGWHELRLPLIADRDLEIQLSPNRWANFPAGHVLHEERFDEDLIHQYRASMGEQAFEAQYNQRPLPPGGALFKLQWFSRYDQAPPRKKVQGIFQSWDTAYDIQGHNDYSVCTTWALSGKDYYLLDVYRERLEFPDLEKAVHAQREKWEAGLVIVEKAGSGISLYQNICRKGCRWIDVKNPVGSKQDRASQQTPKFERGEIWLPREATWLQAFEDEFASFPHGKHDDQVDSVVQFLAACDTGKLPRLADLARGY